MKKIYSQAALFVIWLVIMLPVVEAQSMSFQDAGGDTTPPAITSVQITHGPQTVITWNTDEPSNSKIEFGTTTAIDQIMNKPDAETAHSLTLQTTSGTPYHYRITSCDTAENCKSTSLDNFIAGPFYIQATVPRYAKSTKLDIPGSTRPGATVSVIVNNVEVRKDQIDDGEFFFKNVQLLKAANTIQLKAALGTETAEANYQIDIDDQPPMINVTLPAVVTTQSATAKVKVSEPVNLTVELAKPTGDKPLRPTDLKEGKVEAGRVEISWKSATPAAEYGIYRNNKRIATTASTQYTDTTVGAGKQYQYQVSAANDKCIESDLSDIITVQTPTGQNTEQTTPEKLFSCEKAKQTFSFEGQKDIQVPLQEGENYVTFTATDKAGYKSIAEERVLYDTGPPKFLEQNLKQLSPTYSQEIKVKGKLSERGSVTAFVNGKPQKTEPTEADGTFTISVKLERTINYTAEQTRSSLDTGISWKSKVKLEAIDAAGLKSTSDEVQVEYALCGSGTWINVEMTEPMPDILNPRMLIEGIQQLGLAFNYEYKGGYKAVINPRDIRVKKLNLAPEFQKEYDNGLVTTYTPPVRAQRAQKPTGAGYIQINFQPIEDPWALTEKDKDPKEKAPANATMYSKEERISQHREGDCLAPGFGCMRLFLELEIPFQEETEQLGYLPDQKGGTIEQKKLTNRVQRTCINIEVAIDKRIPPDYIPSGLLRTIRDLLTTFIDTIDKVIKPIETIGKYLFYACVASTFLSIVPIFLEKYNCEYKKYEQMLGGEGKFDPKVAEIGMCEKEYAGNDEAMQNCTTCQDWKGKRKSFQRTYQQICDRVMCPAAPSLQFYLKTRGRQKPTAVNAPTATKQADKGYIVDGKLFTGSDCSAWLVKRQIDLEDRERKAASQQIRSQTERRSRIFSIGGPQEAPPKLPVEEKPPIALAAVFGAQVVGQAGAQPTQQRTSYRIPPRLYFTKAEIEEIYNNWITHKSDTAGSEEGGVNCAGLHPATPECCGYEYMQEWSSACGVSALGSGLDTFDEIKESTCLAEQKANSNEIPGIGDQGPTKCSGPGNLLNLFSGFCTKDNQPTPESIRVVPFQGGPETNNTMQSRLQLGATKDKYMYLLMIPREGATDYDLRLGYIYETVEFEKTGQTKTEERRHKVNTKVEGIELDTSDGMQEKYFSPEHIQKYNQNQLDVKFYADFTDYLCTQAGYSRSGCGANGKNVYDQVMAHISTPDKEYIIKPNEGLINSIRCLCFPTVIGYLKLWRKILAEVRNCVTTILVTGDGEAGVCQAVISRYVCDLLYEVLACFTQKFSAGQTRAEGGDIIGALTASGTEMSRSVEARYGDTGMYKAAFVDRKLVHSICMFAFTGTWNFDLGTIFDQSIDTIPLDSQALLMPCNRRFVAFNPSTRPPGLTTWVYHFGAFIAAGANIDTELHLVCSGGYNCKESDGFENGKCDCVAPRDVVIMPQELPTRIKKNDIISQEIFYTMTAGPPESQIRYDKAYLKYTYKDGTKVTTSQTDPCSIGLTGGPGSVPSFCRFDLLAQSFRCQFGEAEGAIRFPGVTVTYPNQPLDVFAVKDYLNVELKIQQDYPGQEAQAKHLQYEVLNSAGQIVETNRDRGLFMLTTNGDYTKLLGPADPPSLPIVVKKEWFQAGTGTGQAQVSEWYSGTGKPGSLAGPAARPVVERSTLRITQQGVQTTGQYVLVLTKQANAPVYEIHKGVTPKPPTTAGFEKGTRVCSGALPPAFSTLTCQDEGKTITIQITDARPSADQNDRYEVYIGFGQTPGSSPCDGADRLIAQPFKIKFIAYDSDRYGQPTEQVTLDPLTGQEGIVEIPLKIVCANNDDSDFKAHVDKQRGILGPAEVISGLLEKLKAMLEQENNDMLMIAGKPGSTKGFLTSEDSLHLRISEINGFFDTIISNELKHASALQTYVIKLSNTTIPELKELKIPVTDLYNMLRSLNETEMETSFADRNIIYQASEIKKTITGKTDPQIRTTLQGFLTLYNQAIAQKQSLITLIPTIVKVAATPCPSGKTDPADQAYYLCVDEGAPKPGEPWKPADRPCFTAAAQKCYMLPKDNNCAGVTTDDTAFFCQATCPEKSIAYKPQQGEPTRTCPTAGQTCCRKTITGLEKLQELKKTIFEMQRKEKEAVANLGKKVHPTNDERLLEQMIPFGEQAPLIQMLTGIIGVETVAQKNLQSTIDKYTAEQVKIPPEVFFIIDGLVFPFGFGFEVLIPGIPDVIEGLKQVKKDLLSNTKPQPYFIRSQIAKAQETIRSLEWLKRGAIEGINQELGIGTCQVGYNSGRYDLAVEGVMVIEDSITDVQICSATSPGELWKEVPNAACPGLGEKCFNGQPKIYYTKGTDSFQPLLTSARVKFNKGEQVTFQAKIPVIQSTDITDSSLVFDYMPITSQKTSGPNYVQLEATRTVEQPTSIGADYRVQEKQGFVGSSFEITCPASNCKATPCDAGETKEPYTCPEAKNCCSAGTAPTVTALLAKYQDTPTQGCPSGYQPKGRFSDKSYDWAVDGKGSTLNPMPAVPPASLAEIPEVFAVLCVSDKFRSQYGENVLEFRKQCSTDQSQVGWIENLYGGWAYDATGAQLYAKEKLSLCLKQNAAGKAMLAVYDGTYGRPMASAPNIIEDMIWNAKAKCPGGAFQGNFHMTAGESFTGTFVSRSGEYPGGKYGIAGAYHYPGDVGGRIFIGDLYGEQGVAATWKQSENGVVVRSGTMENVGLCMVETPTVTKKTLPRPVYLGDSFNGCDDRAGSVGIPADNTKYVRKGMWTYGFDNWARSDWPRSLKGYDEWLQLCISTDLVVKYGQNVVHLQATTSKDEKACPTGTKHKGWFTSDHDNWGIIEGTTDIRDDDAYFHLCVDEKAINALGNFVYLGVQKTMVPGGEDEASFYDYDCDQGTFKGDFIMYAQSASYPSGATVRAGEFPTRVGLCVKPVQI